MLSGEELSDPGVLERYRALIIVMNADPGQQGAGLPPEAKQNTGDYIKAGVRVLRAFP
ncbi:MAG: hypothetical protein QGI33_07315 [Candidatus Brocadiia bacterium]|nr:hypothetical protein [Candidatus Brocadiia bacterium]